jgi:hypothetical protein
MIRRFNRFELKFVIHVRQRDALRDDLSANMRTDTHGQHDGYYRVTSLYYDTPQVSCFWSKVEGIRFRRKLRLRVYGPHVNADSTPVMAEIKQRINRTVQKRRVCLPLQRAYALAEGEDTGPYDDRRDAAVAAEIGYLARSLHLKPACVISYFRQAWVGSDYEPGLRITFDQDLVCRGPELGLRAGLSDHLFAPPDWLIMEVKVNEAVPLWVTRLLARHGCHLRRISKYCEGLALLRSLQRSGERVRGELWTSS